MGRNQYKSKVEGLEANIIWLENENAALKNKLMDMEPAVMELKMANAGLMERLRMVEIAARGESR
jgi:hypothetical protein